MLWENPKDAIITLMILLMVIGCVNVFSASFVKAEAMTGNPYHFLIRYLFLCRRIRLSDRPVYHYSTDNVSVVRTWDGKKEEGYRDSLIAVRACLQTQPLVFQDTD